jgi:hypothetical protein
MVEAVMNERFGDVTVLHFTQHMPFLAGSAFLAVYMAEDEDEDPVESLSTARDFWEMAVDSGQPAVLPGLRSALEMPYWRYIAPRLEHDWMARVLGDMIFEEWQSVFEGIDARREFYVANGGRA